MRRSIRPRQLDNFRQLPLVLRGEPLVWLDEVGNQHNVSRNDAQYLLSLPPPEKSKQRFDIPIMAVHDVATYDADTKPDYIQPVAYIRSADIS